MLLCALTALAVAALDKTVTMYHVNPLRFGPIPRNTDAADVAGDLFFELFEVLALPLQCSDPDIPPWRKPFSCRNLEVNDPTDVVNKITLNVDSHFSGYAMCNIGNKQGKDPLGRPCPVGGYCCYCSKFDPKHPFPPKSAPCNATVGASDLYSHFGTFMKHAQCNKDYDCWTKHSAAKLTKEIPGYWYSPLAFGDCRTHPAGGPNCTWSVKSVDKIVNATCHSNSFFGAVQAAAPAPFANCTGGTNASDPCWIRAFYTAVLGPEASKRWGWKVAGLPLADIVRFWAQPFESDDPKMGGCPGLPIPPREQQEAMLEARARAAMARGPTLRQQLWRDFTRRWSRDELRAEVVEVEEGEVEEGDEGDEAAAVELV